VGALLAVANFRFFSEFECRFKFGLGGLYRVNLMCKDEATARERAKALVDEHDVELWQRDRHIATFKHER
jgi:hypothetical protein